MNLQSFSRPGTASGTPTQPVSCNLSPEILSPLGVISLRGRGPERRVPASLIHTPQQGDTCQQLQLVSAPSFRNLPAGHILAGPRPSSWAGLTSQVEKHRSHSFHVKSSRCGLSSFGGGRAVERGGWSRRPEQPASLLTRLAALSLPDAAGRGCHSRTHSSPSFPSTVPWDGGGTGCRGRGRGLGFWRREHLLGISLLNARDSRHHTDKVT